jgi:hypothetical protein
MLLLRLARLDCSRRKRRGAMDVVGLVSRPDGVSVLSLLLLRRMAMKRQMAQRVMQRPMISVVQRYPLTTLLLLARDGRMWKPKLRKR